MRGTFMNSGSGLSIGISSLSWSRGWPALPASLRFGLTAQGGSGAVADEVAGLAPVGSLFASFLGYNQIQTLLEPSGTLDRLPDSNLAALTCKEFFPHLIYQPFHDGVIVVFLAAAIMSVVGAAASWVCGDHYVHEDD